MLVYRDLHFSTTLSALRRRLQRQLEATDPEHLDELRTLLIQAGQFEQAFVDELPSDLPSPIIQSVQSVTDHAAAAFYSEWSRYVAQAPTPVMSTRAALGCVRERLRKLRIRQGHKVRVKVPEGFAFYALFPDQYCASIVNWLRQGRVAQDVHAEVVGIRSIGTTLSAVVAAVLQAAHVNVTRVTIRPEGDVFSRRLDSVWTGHFSDQLRRRIGKGRSVAFIVDEGPGISGSSMVAAAEALQAGGYPRNQIWFLPGHDHSPGHAATKQILEWWTSSRVLFTPLDRLRWNGSSLREMLASKTSQLCGLHCRRVEDLSNGRWRKRVFARASDWPAAYGVFERMKLRCVLHDKSAVLWKFVGLGAWISTQDDCSSEAWNAATHRFKTGFGPETLAMFSGFLATRWVQGRALTASELESDQIQTEMVRFLSKQPLLQHWTRKEHADALMRLRTMLGCNVREFLGEDAARAAEARARHVQSDVFAGLCSNGDMARCNWIRSQRGHLYKVGGSLPDGGHTMIGRQPIVWDVAGALVEWGLPHPVEQRFLAQMRRRRICSGIAGPALDFYKLAYAAFRVGQLTICMQWQSPASRERKRLIKECLKYKKYLQRELV